MATAATVNNKKTTSPASQGHRKKMPAVIMVASKLEAIFYSSISDIGTKWKSSEKDLSEYSFYSFPPRS